MVVRSPGGAARQATSRHAVFTGRVAGIAGVGYAVGVGVENMDVLGAPRLGSPVTDIRAAFGDGSHALLGVVTGGLALVLFVVFAVGLHRRLSAGGGWALAGLVGGILGPLLAAVGVATDVLLVGFVARLPDDAVRGLFEIHPRLQLVAGPFVALFLLGFGVAGLRTGALSPLLARPARVLGVPLLLTPLALLDPGGIGSAMATVGFGVFSLWVFLTALWLLLAGPIPDVVFVRRGGVPGTGGRGRVGGRRAARGASRHRGVLLVGPRTPAACGVRRWRVPRLGGGVCRSTHPSAG
jgi:hypothetical protein